MKIDPIAAISGIAACACFFCGWILKPSVKSSALLDGIYIGTNGIVYSIDRGILRWVTREATNVTVITRSGVVATTEIRLH